MKLIFSPNINNNFLSQTIKNKVAMIENKKPITKTKEMIRVDSQDLFLKSILELLNAVIITKNPLEIK